MDVDGWIERLQFADVRGEKLRAEVADVEGAGAVVRELVCGGATDAEGGIRACYYDYFVFYSPMLCSSEL